MKISSQFSKPFIKLFFIFLTQSLVDEVGLKAINDVAMATKEAVDKGQWLNATDLWGKTEGVIANWTNGVNLYNIIDWHSDMSSKHQNNKKTGKVIFFFTIHQ